MTALSFKSIIITGASSGLGEALALVYATPGVHLGLTGRNAERLHRVAEQCRQRGATVKMALLDVRDRGALAAWLRAVDQESPVDLVIANAGISAGTGDGGESEDQARHIFATNVDGVLNTFYPLLDSFKKRRQGHIAIVSSLASFRGFPGAPAYCASKAAVRVYGEALRTELASEKIGVSVICPGFVDTPMTAVNKFPMPFLMTAEKAVRHIQRGLAQNKPRIAFPWISYAFVLFLGLLPQRWVDFLLSHTPKKTAQPKNKSLPQL